MMRTTLTLDGDVATRLQQIREERGLGFKELVNEALRRGLDDMARPQEPRQIYRTEGWDLGGCLLPDIDDIASVLAYGEGEHYR